MQTTGDDDRNTYSRLFFALWPDEPTRQRLTRVTATLSAQAGKPVVPNNFHVTLVFLGTVDQTTASAIKQRACDISVEPFELTFESLNYWQRPKICCLTCKDIPSQIIDLASKLDALARQSGLQTDPRSYIPHITLSRHAQSSSGQTITPIVWRADAFCLVQSNSEPEGVCYRVLQRWPSIRWSDAYVATKPSS